MRRVQSKLKDGSLFKHKCSLGAMSSSPRPFVRWPITSRTNLWWTSRPWSSRWRRSSTPRLTLSSGCTQRWCSSHTGNRLFSHWPRKMHFMNVTQWSNKHLWGGLGGFTSQGWKGKCIEKIKKNATGLSWGSHGCLYYYQLPTEETSNIHNNQIIITGNE